MILDVRQQLKSMEIALVRAPRRAIFDGSAWASDIPAAPGVYALWSLGGSMVYVGETSSLNHRMRDLGRSINHTCRRKLAERHHATGASELAISEVMSKHYVLSFIPVELGRTELEEYLSLKHKRTLINSPGRRLLQSNAYSWVEQL